MAEVDILEIKCGKMKSDIKNDMVYLVDECGLGNLVYHTNNIVDAIN